jgi:hypothetical protein
MAQESLEAMPGFRRRFRITPEPGRVCCEVEDDYHCMSVVVSHSRGVATDVEVSMRRVPWTTCPGAADELAETFTGVELSEFSSRGARRKENCTHLYDLAQLAAAHALDDAPRVYDVLVSDPVDGRRRSELRQGGRTILGWIEEKMCIVEPQELAGIELWNMQSWIGLQEPAMQEAARLLRWGNIMANGRVIPLDRQSDASRMPPNCYSFQPERAKTATRVGEVFDFSAGSRRPLQEYEAFN